jgi:hypothetical protein
VCGLIQFDCDGDRCYICCLPQNHFCSLYSVNVSFALWCSDCRFRLASSWLCIACIAELCVLLVVLIFQGLGRRSCCMRCPW